MYRKAQPLFLICNTPTHVGSGSELGVVDLPIQRERHTGFPKFEASSLKGSIREAFERHTNSREFKNLTDVDVMIHRVFGFDDGSLSTSQRENLKRNFKKENGKNQSGEPQFEDISQFAGAIGFTDARLLLFPVKSMKGVFAWVTCLRALKQFQNDMQLVNSNFQIKNLDENIINKEETYLFASDSNLVTPNRRVLLEEYAFEVSNELNGVLQIDGKNFPNWLAENLFENDGSYWCEKIKKDIVVLPDDDFKDFVNLSTEVITRTKIDNVTGTVAQGALFNEEYLPTESILYSLVLTSDEFKEHGLKESAISQFFRENITAISTIQIGANATLGKGIVTTKLVQL